MSGPNEPLIRSQVRPRESGTATAIPWLAAVSQNFSRPALPLAPCNMRINGKGFSGVYPAGIERYPSRPVARPKECRPSVARNFGFAGRARSRAPRLVCACSVVPVCAQSIAAALQSPRSTNRRRVIGRCISRNGSLREPAISRDQSCRRTSLRAPRPPRAQ